MEKIQIFPRLRIFQILCCDQFYVLSFFEALTAPKPIWTLDAGNKLVSRLKPCFIRFLNFPLPLVGLPAAGMIKPLLLAFHQN